MELNEDASFYCMKSALQKKLKDSGGIKVNTHKFAVDEVN